MAVYVLIHGGFHDGRCWHLVARKLEERGHKVLTPSLPGHGENLAQTSAITKDAYTECIKRIVEEQEEPVILVGHSMSGMFISEVAEQLPSLVSRLVYITAFLIDNGESLAQWLEDHEYIEIHAVLPNAIFSEDGKSAIFPPDKARLYFYNACSQEIADQAIQKLNPQAAAPLTTPIEVSVEKFGKISKVYIECLQDRSLPLALQREMQRLTPCDVISIEADHSPFYSQPEKLADYLHSLSA